MVLTVNEDTRINLFHCSAKYQHVSSATLLFILYTDAYMRRFMLWFPGSVDFDIVWVHLWLIFKHVLGCGAKKTHFKM